MSKEAIILAGGLGTRLREVISDMPKPLAPIQETPFLDLLLHQLADCKSVERVILAVGYQAPSIINHYNQHAFPFTLEFSREEMPLGTGGAVRKALDYCSSNKEVLVLNGDSYLEIDYEKFIQFHRRHDSEATIACCEMEDAARFGKMEFDSENFRLKAFKEKSPLRFPGWINGGIYLIEPALLKTYVSGCPFSMEKEFFPSVIERKIFCYPACGQFMDIGTADSYRAAQTGFLSTLVSSIKVSKL